MTAAPASLTKIQARRVWLRAQRLDVEAPFGNDAQATLAAIAHLGYVQIDTIHVIERCHHHILFTRIPGYRREHLHRAQTQDKTVFEYWAHALAYMPTADFRYHVRDMRNYSPRNDPALKALKDGEVARMVARIRREGPLNIRDIDDEVLLEKAGAWSSRKPSRRSLQLAFNKGLLTVSERTGMLKTYELTTRHFGWPRLPAAASENETARYVLDRALTAQALVSLHSACYLDAPAKPAVRRLIESRVRRKELVPVEIEGVTQPHWARPATLEELPRDGTDRVHILSPFDPLIIQRKRLESFFGYSHLFEAYVPRHKRGLGYFVCPVLLGDQGVAALDLKTERAAGRLDVRRWNWVGSGSARAHKRRIEEALHSFERFQLAR